MEVTFTKAAGRRYVMTVARERGPRLASRHGPGYDDHLPHDAVPFPAGLTPLRPGIGRPEDVVLAGGDLAEDTAGQARLGLRQEVHGIMGQVIVVARTMP